MSTTIVYIAEGEPFTGTVQDLAQAIALETYSDISVDRMAWVPVRTVKGYVPLPRQIKVESTGYDSDDFATLTVTVEGVEGEGTVRVDGRA